MKPLSICLIIHEDSSWIGGIQYISNIALALASLKGEKDALDINLLCRRSVDPSLYQGIVHHLSKVYYFEADLAPLTFSNRLSWKMARMIQKRPDPRSDSFFKSQKFDFVYPYTSSLEQKLTFRAASWIPDFQHHFLPQLFPKQDVKHRNLYFAEIASTANHIFLSSSTAQKHFQRFYPGAKAITHVMPFCSTLPDEIYTGDPLSIQREYYLPDRFFLVSNQFFQHKNHLLIFEALNLLRRHSIHPNVVCTGCLYDQREPHYQDRILQTIHRLGLAGQVYLLGLIPRFHQLQLMRRSLAVIQPSLFEGWSTVVEDAKSLGKRILLSDLEVHREQNPPSVAFFPPDSARDLAKHIAAAWESAVPGPDLAGEAAAQTAQQQTRSDFGSRFLDTVRRICT
jgi:glycosyltransferase involved in cell wall biosynthesis